ncbi:MAG: phosphoribulokinase [Candidatus Sedimenticola endophacoides]|uniref:phosphoribulokinase n=1 Tax=Candidatus Sedimenticola endophacoides TaxID=2548426 RepID=A0A657PRI6_9GAMM|nr:MAG: phosphoribulokinase [Candidatus Sedimenticola endophacoides]OQX32879.1 MAG: phosphoribulokinase [Candidatus Sedimenticola endophacoides]OQX42627.1 MAG: phosphoribulokinase [Candidatus Sedimenticola endophacoides]OQX42730.1 MAG: phosphoribulokinase [Candidatus Sedimenticola endophacoides]OQX44130.1 MAG: phosphoribulokinase [Candidatus Sedimenticola endophacoides]
MSHKFPIISITGSSGSGSHKVGNIFAHIAWRQKINPLLITGSGFHRYERDEMNRMAEESHPLTHFSPLANHMDLLEKLFREFSESGQGRFRHYIHSEADVRQHNRPMGTFTPWEEIPEGTDLLVYKGLHGAYIGDGIDLTRYADFTIGVAPIVNLEWIQKIHNDINNRGYTLDAVKRIIESRLNDYVRSITPQFSKTDVNFQRIPLVDTSNPFITRDVPSCEESMVVIRFRYPNRFDFPYLLKMIDDSFMSRRNTIVVPGGKMEYAMELLLNPIVERMMEKRLKQ